MAGPPPPPREPSHGGANSWSTAIDVGGNDESAGMHPSRAMLHRLKQHFSGCASLILILTFITVGCVILALARDIVGPAAAAVIPHGYIFIFLRLFGDLLISGGVLASLFVLNLVFGRPSAIHAAASMGISQKAFSGMLASGLLGWGVALLLRHSGAFFAALPQAWEAAKTGGLSGRLNSEAHPETGPGGSAAFSLRFCGCYVYLAILTLDVLVEFIRYLPTIGGICKFVYHKIDHKVRKLPLVQFHGSRYDNPEGYSRISDFDGSVVHVGGPVAELELPQSRQALLAEVAPPRQPDQPVPAPPA